MATKSERERLAVVEVELKGLKELFVAEQAAARERDAAMVAQIGKLSEDITKYKGFWGGVTLVLSAVFSVVGLVWANAKGWFNS